MILIKKTPKLLCKGSAKHYSHLFIWLQLVITILRHTRIRPKNILLWAGQTKWTLSLVLASELQLQAPITWSFLFKIPSLDMSCYLQKSVWPTIIFNRPSRSLRKHWSIYPAISFIYHTRSRSRRIQYPNLLWISSHQTLASQKFCRL